MAELAQLANEMAKLTTAGQIEIATDPEEEALLLESLTEDPDEPVFTLEEAKGFLAQYLGHPQR